MPTINKRKKRVGIGSRSVPKNQLTAITEVFREMIYTMPEFHSDGIREKCLQRKIPNSAVSNALPALFKKFLAARSIKKTGRFVLSERNSQPIFYYSKTGKGQW